MEKTNIEGYRKVCPYCRVGIISMYEKQLKQNYKVHLDNCQENPINLKEVKQNETGGIESGSE